MADILPILRKTLSFSVSVSFIHSNQRDVGTWGTMHELVIT